MSRANSRGLRLKTHADARAWSWAALAFGGLLCLFCVQALASETSVTVDSSRIGDASHFEFSGHSDWKYDLKRDSARPDRVTLSLSGLSADAIGRLKKHSDALVTGVTVNEKGADGSVEVTFQLKPGSDFFDYLTEQPSRLIVDFFPREPGQKDDEPEPSAKPKPKQKQKAAPAVAKDESDDEPKGSTADISELITGELPAKKEAKSKKDAQSRQPAGTDFVVVSKNDPLPSLAERISAEKDFNHGIFDGGDPEFRRFMIKDYEIKQDSILASRANFYLPFPMLDQGNPQLRKILEARPTYEIVPNDTRENKEARVLLNLFNSKKRALFLKGAQEFLVKYPESAYDEIVRYMVADTHYALWRTRASSPDFESAMGMYQLLTEKYPKSPVTPRTQLLLGYSYHDRGDSFGALKAFQRFVRTNPESRHLDRVNVAVGESYLRLNRFDDAFAIFDGVEKEPKTKRGKFEAAFRKGDVFFRKKDWDETIRQYKRAIDTYPAEANLYPNAFYNVAEAEFQRGKYRDALEAYRLFLQRFPEHEHGGYAMTRMGELLGILGADPRRAQGAYFESYFRYRATPGAGIARIRSLASRMKEMKDKELHSSLREIASITDKYTTLKPEPKKDEKSTDGKAVAGKAAKEESGKASGKEGAPAEGSAKEAKESAGGKDASAGDETVASEDEDKTKRAPELPGIEEFSTLLIADGFTDRKEYDRAFKDLVTYYQQNPQSPNKQRFFARIIGNITLGVRAAVEKGDFIDALRRYSKNSSGWLKNADRIDVRYLVGRSYEQAGVFKEAGAIYKETLKRLTDLSRDEKATEHRLFEDLPTKDAVRLRLAVVAAKDKDMAGAESFLKAIGQEGAGSGVASVKNESKPELNEPEQIERAGVAADVAEARGQGEVARQYLGQLLQTWKGDQRLTSPLHLRIAKIAMTAKDYKVADAHVDKVLEMQKAADPIDEEAHARALEIKGDLQLARGKRTDAIATYRELLETYEAKRSLASIRYKAGQLLFEDGDLKGAESTWSELNEVRDTLWARLAKEQMAGAKWQNEYKKYLNRIPAAADLRSTTGR